MAATTETYNLKIKVGAEGVERIDVTSSKVDKLDRKVKTGEKSMRKYGQTASAIPKQLKLMAAAIMSVVAVLAVLGTGLAGVVSTHSQFQRSMSNVASVAGATADELDKLSKAAREQAKTSVFSAREAADAQYYLASAGMSVTEIIEAQRGVMDLAAATQAELAYTAESVASALSQFGLQASDATRVANVYAAAISGSQATMQKLTDSMRYAGPIAAQLGQSLEGTTAQLMALYNGGLRGEQAGTALRAAMLRLQDPTKEMAVTLAEMNVQITDNTGKTRPFIDIIAELSKNNMDAGQATKIFGQEAAAAMLILAKDLDKVRKYKEEITGTAKATEMANRQTDNLWGDWKKFNSAVEELALTFASELDPALRGAVQGLTYLTEELTEFTEYASKSTSFELLVDIFKVVGGVFEFLSKGVIDTAENSVRLVDAFLQLISVGEWVLNPYQQWIRLLETLKLKEEAVAGSSNNVTRAMHRMLNDPEYDGSGIARSVNQLQEAVEAEKKATEEQAKKLKELMSLREKYSEEMHLQTLTAMERELRALDQERQAFIALGGDKLEFADYWRRREQEIREKYASKTRKAEDKELAEAKKRIKERLKAYEEAQSFVVKLTETESQKIQRIYNEKIEKLTELERKRLITQQQFEAAKTKLTKEAAQDQLKLEEKQRAESLTGWRKALAEWANAYQNTTALMEEGAKRTFNTITSSFRSLVSDALQGEFDSIADFFDELGRKLLETWADILIQMASKWAMSGIGSLLEGLLNIGSGSGSSGATSLIGTIGSTIWDAAGGSDVLRSIGQALGLISAPASEIGTVAGAGLPGIVNIGGIGTSGAGAVGAGAAAGLGTLAAGAGIGAAAIGIMYGVTSLLGSLTADPWDKESATEMINAQADYLRRIQELQSSGSGPNLFSQDSIDAVLWGDKLAGIAEMSPAQLQELYYSTGSAGARIYSGAHTSKSLEDHIGGILSNWQSTFTPGAEYANTGETDTLYYTLAQLTSNMGLSGNRQTQLLTGVEDLINQYNTGKLDLDEGDLSQNEALAEAVQGFYLDTLNEMMESGEITMEHMRAIQRMLADADTNLIPFFDTSGMGEWESPFTLNNLTDDQFMEMLELEGAVEDARLEVLGQLKTVMDGLAQSEYDWAASMYESLAAIDTQNLSSEELAETINNELNPALHIQRNLERDLADGMSVLDAHTKARNETINALLSSTGLSADREQELIDILIRESGTVQDLTGKWNRYNEIQELLSNAHNLTQEQIQDLVNEGRDLHEQLGLNQTDFSNLTDSVEDLVDEIGRLIDYMSSIPSSVNTSVNTHYNNYHHNYYDDNGGQYHGGGLVKLHSGGSVAQAIMAQAMKNNLVTMHGGGHLPKSDELLALLRLGEYVVQDTSVNDHTLPWLEYVNENGEVPGLVQPVLMGGGPGDGNSGGTLIYSPTYNIEVRDSVVAADEFIDELGEEISERTIDDVTTLTAAGYKIIDSRGVGDTRRFNHA